MRVVSVLAVAGPLALVGFAAAVVCLLPAWRMRAAAAGIVLGLLGAGLQVAWLAPRYVGGRSATADLTVMSVNLHLGRADPGAVVRAVRRDDVDVVVLVEVTPTAYSRLVADGLTDLLPHRVGEPRPEDEGVVVLARWPLSPPDPVAVLHGGLRTTVAASTPFVLLAVHPGDALFHPRRWARDLRLVSGDVATARRETGDDGVVVAGDLNSTLDQGAFRAMLQGAGLRDAAEQAGAGLAPTWPADRLVPLITIDHVLTGAAYRATDTRRVRIPSSDHLALVARLERLHG